MKVGDLDFWSFIQVNAVTLALRHYLEWIKWTHGLTGADEGQTVSHYIPTQTHVTFHVFRHLVPGTPIGQSHTGCMARLAVTLANPL